MKEKYNPLWIGYIDFFYSPKNYNLNKEDIRESIYGKTDRERLEHIFNEPILIYIDGELFCLDINIKEEIGAIYYDDKEIMLNDRKSCAMLYHVLRASEFRYSMVQGIERTKKRLECADINIIKLIESEYGEITDRNILEFMKDNPPIYHKGHYMYAFVIEEIEEVEDEEITYEKLEDNVYCSQMEISPYMVNWKSRKNDRDIPRLLRDEYDYRKHNVPDKCKCNCNQVESEEFVYNYGEIIILDKERETIKKLEEEEDGFKMVYRNSDDMISSDRIALDYPLVNHIKLKELFKPESGT